MYPGSVPRPLPNLASTALPLQRSPSEPSERLHPGLKSSEVGQTKLNSQLLGCAFVSVDGGELIMIPQFLAAAAGRMAMNLLKKTGRWKR